MYAKKTSIYQYYKYISFFYVWIAKCQVFSCFVRFPDRHIIIIYSFKPRYHQGFCNSCVNYYFVADQILCTFMHFGLDLLIEVRVVICIYIYILHQRLFFMSSLLLPVSLSGSLSLSLC